MAATTKDIYVVASKAIPVKNAGPLVALVPNCGPSAAPTLKLWGMGGNAPNWQARGFGALAFVFKGPDKEHDYLRSEVCAAAASILSDSPAPPMLVKPTQHPDHFLLIAPALFPARSTS